MLIYHPSAYEGETRIQIVKDDYRHLRYWRMMLVTTGARPGEVPPNLGPYRILVAFAVRNSWGPQRVCYLNIAGAPKHIDGLDREVESDCLLTPASFVAAEPRTTPVTEYGRVAGGPVGTTHHQWIDMVLRTKKEQDHFRKQRGLPIINSSVERWGHYETPTY